MTAVVVNGEMVAVSGRAAVIIAWIIRRAEDVNAMVRGSVTFDFAGTSISPRLTEADEPLQVAKKE